MVVVGILINAGVVLGNSQSTACCTASWSVPSTASAPAKCHALADAHIYVRDPLFACCDDVAALASNHHEPSDQRQTTLHTHSLRATCTRHRTSCVGIQIHPRLVYSLLRATAFYDRLAARLRRFADRRARPR